MVVRYLLVCLLVAPVLPEAASSELQQVISEGQKLARKHRYQEVLNLLGPHLGTSDDPESGYLLASELGRANFHLGHYDRAYKLFQQAVLLRPDLVETAIYLQACAYLVGDRDQALDVLGKLLQAGARDLYLAVTLPGERTFLADPEVWKVIDLHATPLPLDLRSGRFMAFRLGQTRSTIQAALGSRSPADLGPVLTARAGPKVTWAFTFNDQDGLEEMVIHGEHLLRYTPYRLHLACGLDWRLTPDTATAKLGPPVAKTEQDDSLLLAWEFPGVRAVLEFGAASAPLAAFESDHLLLRIVRLSRTADSSAKDSPE